ncbi:MAG: hypothetical protein KAV00_10820, partial [Phycisphaerae bacterium]|nr:hypothetical protein [Phycisphaerae bacterium]
MVDRNLINSLGITDEQVQEQIGGVLDSEELSQNLTDAMQEASSRFKVGSILTGQIVSVIGN